MARFVPILIWLGACGSSVEPSGGETGAGGAGVEGGEQLPDPPAAPSAAEMLAQMEPGALDPSDLDQMRDIASASAPRIFFLASIPLLAARPGQGAGTCPSTTTEGGVTTLRGGCVAEDGTRWTGEAVLRGMTREQPTGEAIYRVFGFQKTVECNGVRREGSWQANGTLFTEPDGDGIRFTVDLSFQGDGVDDECREMEGTGAIQYGGRRVNVGNAMRWSGSGTFGWRGFGKVEASTEDELINQANCRNEALMGSTTIRSAGHEATFRYDGESQCDEEATTPLHFDGAPRGGVPGVGCSATDATSAPWLAIAVFLVAAALRRNRTVHAVPLRVADRLGPRRRARPLTSR